MTISNFLSNLSYHHKLKIKGGIEFSFRESAESKAGQKRLLFFGHRLHLLSNHVNIKVSKIRARSLKISNYNEVIIFYLVLNWSWNICTHIVY